ncbi:MAG: hypothetical protein EPN88_11220 [Bacteroidetes bacterium]|nr:MAG: hypothetical protein EPN88_11220 [Bacteroidota bacterium]
MSKKLVILSLIFLLITPCVLISQARSAFSGDVSKFRSELTAFMGPNLNPEQAANLNTFLNSWDSAAFSKENMVRIIDISSQLSSRQMRTIPHFYDYLITLNNFVQYKSDAALFTNWLTGLSEIAFNPRFSNENIDRYFKNTSSMIKDNVLYESGSVRWKVKNYTLKFLHDTVFYVSISNATLTCYSQKDSTEIYNVTGNYYPETQQLKGSKGTVTWEKAGYPGSDVYVELKDYSLNLTKSSYTIDSVRLKHVIYFKEPVLGVLTDQATSFSNKDKANYPRFTTYAKHFQLKNIYEGVNYEGGLSFEGANVKGTGENFFPAKIALFRHDTLYLKILAKEFLFSKAGLNSQETAISLYLDKDSIYHSNLGFSYLAATRQVNLFRTNNPISKSPYFNSFHNLDMYFEYLSWNMNESKIILSRARGSALGQAKFESSSFFNSDYFLRLMGFDDYHPLNRLMKFAEYYYSETFPVLEFAKWLNRSDESVTGMCIDMANKGFVFYDRINNEVTIKKKTKDFLDSYARKKDYDVLNIISETKAPTDNAILDLKNYRLIVNGVSGVIMSDSQKVAIYPYKQQLIIGKNRSLQFDGVVEAGLFKVFGHNFSFSYDTFKIRLQKIDSIKISVETDKRDMLGNPVVEQVQSLIELGTAELYIDNPDNKSGLISYKQYPIINAITYSYIFYDKIPGLEGIYKQSDFYFKVDPFTYENIDHYTNEDMNLSGEFVGGNILKPMHQFLTIQENNSLGFNMAVPAEGIDVYGEKGKLYNALSISNKGLIGSGTLKHLTSTTRSEEFKFFPDSMITQASAFDLEKDPSGIFPELTSQNVAIKWFPKKDEWLANNAEGKSFDMFGNGTRLDGLLTLTPARLNGTGIINTADSRINSNLYSFTSNAIKADTADYNLKSATTSGYSFIAENANTDINFDLKMTRFRLNTDSSMVKFPELQYICTMTDFAYNMETRILNMEQKGKSNIPLLTADKLLKLDFTKLDKPTFFATNDLTDTVAFSSWKGSYHLDQEYIEAENINYIHIADALIQPENGKIIINRRAKIQQMQNALIAVNNRHILHTAKIDIETTKRYTGSAVYDYLNENKEIQQISFPEISVDTLTTTAKGYIAASQNFMLSPAFSFTGDVKLSARADLLSFTGAAGIVHSCNTIKSYNIKFKASIDPKNVMIPVSDKPRDINDELVFSGSYINTDSIHIYPAFLSAQKSWTDVALVNSSGYLYYEKAKGRYLITSLEKIADQALPGNMIALDKNFCVLSGEGTINFGAKYDLFKLSGAGKVIHTIDSGKVNLEAILALDFHFSAEALKVMADEIRMMPSLKPVNLNTDLNNKGMKDLIGVAPAAQIKEEMDLFGTSRSLPKEFTYELLLNDVNLFWNEPTSSFRSTGKIGIGFIGPQPINTYVDGYIEIQRRRSGDMIDVYLKADESTWYYFSYFRGVMMAQAGNNSFNTILTSTKLSERKHPESSVRVPYTYMIAVEDRLNRFLRRMASNNVEEEPVTR